MGGIDIRHIVSFSGGKDSTAMLLMMVERNMQVDDIVFADTGMEFPEMYEYIAKVESHIKRKITRVKSEKSWDDYFYSKKTRGKYVGTIYGFPLSGGSWTAWCQDRLKIRPLNKYLKEQGEHLIYLGIAYDEPKRIARLQKNARAPLAYWEYTEAMCRKYLEDQDMLNPLYEKFNRLGCWCCPKQNLKALRVLMDSYPDLWVKLHKYSFDSPVSIKDGKTLVDIECKWERQLP